jgi:Lysyl oxidase
MRRYRLARVAAPALLLLSACADDSGGPATGSSLEPDASGANAGAAGSSAPGCEAAACGGAAPADTSPGAAGTSAVSAGGSEAGMTPGASGASSNGGAANAAAGAGTVPGSDLPGSTVPAANVPSPPVGGAPAPDLVLDRAYLVDTTAEDVVSIDDACLVSEGCVTGLGQRRVVRFGSRTGNVGTAALSLGNPGASNPYWAADSCQGGFDLLGFARYELFDASTGASVLTGGKNGFCIRDSEPWQLEGDASCYAYNCADQGISPGCADNYGSELQCQWVDITNVPAGLYTLRVIINATFSVPELDYANNVVDVNLRVEDDEVIIER